MEVAVQSERKGLRLDAAWAPGSQDEEAGAITNGDLGGFSTELRGPFGFAKVEFAVLTVWARPGRPDLRSRCVRSL
eukprot:7446745-Heterocapsa_arctica.AAC.1